MTPLFLLPQVNLTQTWNRHIKRCAQDDELVQTCFCRCSYPFGCKGENSTCRRIQSQEARLIRNRLTKSGNVYNYTEVEEPSVHCFSLYIFSPAGQTPFLRSKLPHFKSTQAISLLHRNCYVQQDSVALYKGTVSSSTLDTRITDQKSQETTFYCYTATVFSKHE